jgi:enoyl-CoA hydratase
VAIEIEKNQFVWTIIHNRPEARNAMDPDSADSLVEAFEAFEKSDARVAVLWGAGGSFCAGWDLKYAASLAQEEQRTEINNLNFPIGSAPAPRALY